MSAERVKLTKAQIDWLAAFRFGPPVEMSWLDSSHRAVTKGPETWVWLMARFNGGRCASIHTDDRAALVDYFDPSTWSLTDAGRAAFAAAGDRS